MLLAALAATLPAMNGAADTVLQFYSADEVREFIRASERVEHRS